MPIRGGSPPPQGKKNKKKFRGGSPPPGAGRSATAWDSDEESQRSSPRGRKRGGRADRRTIVTPLEIPSSREGSGRRSGARESRASDRRLVSPRAGNWDDLSDTEDERRPQRKPRRNGRGGGSERGSQSGRRRKGGGGGGGGAVGGWGAVTKHASKATSKRSSGKRETHWKEDDERTAQVVRAHRHEVQHLIKEIEHEAHAAHHAAHEKSMLDEEHRKRFHSHKTVFTLGAMLFLFPFASFSVFSGAWVLAFPIPGMIYGGLCAAAAW
jgi:hypothetical protein